MELRNRVIVVFAVLIIFLGIQFFVYPEFTGFSTYNSSNESSEEESIISVALATRDYNLNQPIKGNIILTLNSDVGLDDTVKVTFNGNTQEKTLEEILNKLNMSYTTVPFYVNATNPSESKTILAKNKTLALVLPYGSTVNSVSMAIAGTNVMGPYIDVGADDMKEWHYYGDKVSYSGQVKPDSLNLNKEGDSIFITNSESFYCEMINLSQAKDFVVLAKYKAISNQSSLLAHIFNMDLSSNVASLNNYSCVMYPNKELNIGSCEIHLKYGVEGRHLVCVSINTTNTTSQDYYQLVRDSDSSDSRYDCSISEEDYIYCQPSTSKDYLIMTQPGTYSKLLNGVAGFNEWATENDIASSINDQLSMCSPDELGDCSIPILVNSENGGSLTLSNLNIDYTEMSGAHSYTNKFYDSELKLSSFETINSMYVDEYELSVPLSGPSAVFNNLTIKSLTGASEVYDLDVEFMGYYESKFVQFYSQGIQTGVSGDSSAKLNSLKNMISGISEDHLNVIGINTNEMNSFINNPSSTGLDEYLATLPTSISSSGSFSDSLILEPTDIPVEITSEPLELYPLQKKVSVIVDVTVYDLTYPDGDIQTTVIEKTITPKETLNNIEIYEYIPKEVVNSVSEINILNQDYEVVQSDPIIKYSYSSLSQPVKIVYSVPAQLTQALVYDTKTIVGYNADQNLESDSECGDGVCTKPLEDSESCPEDCPAKSFPWLIAIVSSLIFLLLTGYIFGYKGKYDFRHLITLGNKPYVAPQDLVNIKNFIKQAKTKGLKDTDITQKLMDKGWTKKQIVFAFEDIEWDNQRALIIQKAPTKSQDMQILTNYVKECMKLKVDQIKLQQVLLGKGWTQDQIDQAIKKSIKKPFIKIVSGKK